MRHPLLIGLALGAIATVALHVTSWLLGARLADRAAR